MGIMDDDDLDEVVPSEDTIVSFEEGSDVEEEQMKLSPVSEYVRERFNRSRLKRNSDETRWLEAYQNYRGIYSSAVQFTDTEKSRVFIKITKTKVLAAYAQIVDVLFAGGKFPIGIEPSPIPNGDTADSIYFDPEEKDELQNEVSPTIARPDILGPFKKMLSDRMGDKMKEGAGKTPTSQTFEPTKVAARKMEKKIHDQLEESDASKHLRFFASELCLFGHGVMKGPFVVNKEYPKWSSEGVYTPKFEQIPKVDSVSIWNFYPDSEARSIEDCSYTVERHRYSKYQLRDLKKRPNFRSDSIDTAVLMGPNYIPEFWESILEDNTSTGTTERYEILEFWGLVDRELLEEGGVELPPELSEKEDFQANIWVCNGQVLRLILNPFTPSNIPYYAVPYEINPYSFFGVGVAENMSDTQAVMNGSMRMAIDNAAISGNIIIEIDETNMVPGQSLDIYPGKVFRRAGGAPGQAIFGTTFPNVTNQLMQLYDKARQLSDEATGMPSYAHGGTNIGGVGKTAAGMSMLMGAASQNIKAVVRNIDDYLLSKLGKSLFAFNMQFNFDEEFIGDLAIVAKGTDSLMRNEVRSQRLLQFLQITADPGSAPFVKRDYILREIATSLDLDADKVLNDPREAAIQATLMKEMNDIMGIQPQQAGTPQQVPQGGINDSTGTGGGNIAPGNAPEPQTQGFTGGQPPQQI